MPSADPSASPAEPGAPVPSPVAAGPLPVEVPSAAGAPAAVEMAALDQAAVDAHAFDALHEELALWQKEGRPCPFWWRDDDLSVDSPALRTMAEVAERNGVPVLVAVIPARASASLAQDTASMPMLSFCQHGLHHRNNEPAGELSSEFGPARSVQAITADLREGRDIMDALFGPRFLRVFVPPWNRMRPDMQPILKELGMRGVSLYHGSTAGLGTELPTVNAHVDILLWSPTPPILCRPTGTLVERLVTLLQNARAKPGPAAPLGLLTHHVPMLDDAWAFMQRVFEVTKGYSCVRWLSAAELFPA